MQAHFKESHRYFQPTYCMSSTIALVSISLSPRSQCVGCCVCASVWDLDGRAGALTIQPCIFFCNASTQGTELGRSPKNERSKFDRRGGFRISIKHRPYSPAHFFANFSTRSETPQEPETCEFASVTASSLETKDDSQTSSSSR